MDIYQTFDFEPSAAAAGDRRSSRRSSCHGRGDEEENFWKSPAVDWNAPETLLNTWLKGMITWPEIMTMERRFLLWLLPCRARSSQGSR